MFSIRLLKLIYARNIEFNTSKFNQNYCKLAIEIDRKNSVTVFFIGRKYRKKHEFLATSGQVFAQNLDWQERCIRLGWASCLTTQIQEDLFSEIDR